MIKVTYENEDNGQTASFSITPSDDDSAKVKIDFEPATKDDMQDPYGILGKLTYFFMGEK